MEHIIRAFGYSLEGLRAAFRSEFAFRVEVFVFAVFFPFACLINVSPASRAILIMSLFLVLLAELGNTAIEAVVNRISTEIHPLSKKAKDVGSAMVFITLINAGCCWGVILWAKLFS
ncbi:MAG: diacylglycerol kinase [Rickettsiales bacterium]|jgi:diacylglycerol kinase (ATP)|nr:diacylglycerol kinase [Rickettsiales bacterium]